MEQRKREIKASELSGENIGKIIAVRRDSPLGVPSTVSGQLANIHYLSSDATHPTVGSYSVHVHIAALDEIVEVTLSHSEPVEVGLDNPATV